MLKLNIKIFRIMNPKRILLVGVIVFIVYIVVGILIS